jgi:UDP:flavonoid glycosyltransferase YjiC (YdhE family)
MRVLFCTTGGLGHLLPLLPLATALRRRGHAVAWVTAPDALHRLEGLGFDLFAAGLTFEASRREFREAHADAAHLAGEPLSEFTFPRLFGAVVGPAMLGELDLAVRSWLPDLVVHEPAALAAPLVCRQLGLRNVVHGYGLRPPIGYLEDAMQFFGPHWQARGLEAPADGGLYRYLYLDVAPQSLQPPTRQADDSVFRFNPYRPGNLVAPALPADLRTALRKSVARRPRIYVTFGTVFNRSPAMTVAARAAAQLAGTVVVTIGQDGDGSRLTGLGSNVHVHPFVNQGTLLPHCDVVVSHGGAGSLLGAAAHGVQQLILPQAADHFRNARALTALSAGRCVEPGCQTVDVVASSLAGLLHDGSLVLGATNLAREMAAMPDVGAAACHLERWQAGAPR